MKVHNDYFVQNKKDTRVFVVFRKHLHIISQLSQRSYFGIYFYLPLV
jgi:hypothetical protein